MGFEHLSVSPFPEATCGGDSSGIPPPALQPHQSKSGQLILSGRAPYQSRVQMEVAQRAAEPLTNGKKQLLKSQFFNNCKYIYYSYR